MNACLGCCKTGGTLMHSCAQCKLAHYCDRACQKKDWKVIHQYICTPNPVSSMCIHPKVNLDPIPRGSDDEGTGSEGGGAHSITPVPVAASLIGVASDVMAKVLGAVRTAVMQEPEPVAEPAPEDEETAVPQEEKEEEEESTVCPVCKDNTDTNGDGQPGGHMAFGCCFKCGTLICGMCCRQVSRDLPRSQDRFLI